MKRSFRAQVAKETLAILDAGTYTPKGGRPVSIRNALKACEKGTVLYTPATLAQLGQPEPKGLTTRFEVTNETTLAAGRRLAQEAGLSKVACLNFASAKNIGGGFQSGGQAQEESLARASGLYKSQGRTRVYYDANRDCATCLYTDHIIYSPDVPVFRDDAGQLLEQPYVVSMITAPAVNAGAVRKVEPDKAEEIGPVMRRRAGYVLGVAQANGCQHLVLGAWGCGVFENEPKCVAGIFGELLLNGGPYAGAFATVVFAVLDRSEDESTIGPFRARFGQQ
ncbi:MAG: TIGR02452 family protein [Thermoguttaceae bacterium]